VAGEIDQCELGAFRLVAKIVQRPAHLFQRPVLFDGHVEAQTFQRLGYRLRIMVGIVERPQELIFLSREDERYALACRGRRRQARENSSQKEPKQDPHRPSPYCPSQAKPAIAEEKGRSGEKPAA
jgi:hypothetical protein